MTEPQQNNTASKNQTPTVALTETILKTSSAALLSVKNVGVKYERRVGRWKYEQFWAIKNVSFDIHRGETVGIIGRNGAGKSTLLRLLAGIYKADRGQVIKHEPYKASLIALNVGFVAHLSGRDNVVLGALLLGLSRREANSIVEKVKTYSGLGDYFEQAIITYSTGMKSRLAFSVAFFANPDIILLDETLGVGDKDFVEKSTRDIENKITKNSQTVVITSHSMGAIKKLCSKVIWIEKGIVFGMGDAEEVVADYLSYKSHSLK